MNRQNWFDVRGDETLALDWQLNEDSLVWEIGGFEGRWAQQIWDKFHCNITIFEPQLWAVKKMQERFAGNKKISIRPYGLWVQSGKFYLGNFYTDGASLINDDGREEKKLCQFDNIFSVISSKDLPVDLCLMNIEGAEYEILPFLIGVKGWKCMEIFKNFWCQFHPQDENDNRHEEIFEKMSHTHDLLWDCFPTAAAWRRR